MRICAYEAYKRGWEKNCDFDFIDHNFVRRKKTNLSNSLIISVHDT